MANIFKNNTWIEILIILLVVILPSLATIYFCKLALGSEFAPYYAISRLIKAGAYSQIYNANVIQGMEKTLVPDLHVNSVFISAPIISWAFYPLSLLKFKESFYAWTGVLIACSFVSCFILNRYFNLRGPKGIWAAVLLGSLGPLTISLSKGYATPALLMAAAGLLVNLKKRRYFTASVFQVLFWLQPQLIFPLLCFESGLGQFYTIVITILLSIIGLLISFLVSSFSIGRIWFQLFWQEMHNWQACLFDNTLQGELLRLGLHKELAGHIALAVYLLLFIGAYFMGKKVRSRKLPLNMFFTALIPLSLLLSLRSSSHDLLLLYPGILTFILMPINHWLKYLRAALIMITLIFLILPFNILISSHVTEGSVFNPFLCLLIAFPALAFAIEHYAKGGSAPAAAGE